MYVDGQILALLSSNIHQWKLQGRWISSQENQFTNGNTIKQIIMHKCALKYIAKKDDTTTKNCVASLITQKNRFLVS